MIKAPCFSASSLSERAVRPEKEACLLDRIRKEIIWDCERKGKRGRTQPCMGSNNKRKGSDEKKTKSYFHKNSFWKTAAHTRSTPALEASLRDYFGISKREEAHWGRGSQEFHQQRLHLDLFCRETKVGRPCALPPGSVKYSKILILEQQCLWFWKQDN